MAADNAGAAPKILLLDDDPDLLELVGMVLGSEGFDVRTARHGGEGLAEIEASGMPDLVLLDLKMPVMDGFEFARLYREKYPDGAPILVLTAADDPRKRAAEVQAAGWVSKPFDIDALIQAIRRHLRKKHAAPT